ncbi:biopolymer transporter ExbD [Myxococcota bacterium]|nr:biopolymer transporter ExbD [Myxococcota bacterium]
MLSERIRQKRGPLKLQLTSLLDMFTIILVFLMVSYQEEDKEFVLHADVKLPTSSAENPLKTAVNVAVTMSNVLVDGVKVYKLAKGGKLKKKEFKKRHIQAVTEAVKEAWARIEAKGKETGEEKEQVVVVQADKGMPYETLHTVMRSAAQGGFVRFRLVVGRE